MPIIGQARRPDTPMNKFSETFKNLSEDKKRKILEIKSIRDNIGNFISKKDQINKLLEIIDGSEVFSMKNKRNRKIDTRIPLFVMIWDWEKAEEKYNFKSNKEKYSGIDPREYQQIAGKYIADENMIAHIALEEIFRPFSSWMASYLTDNEKFKEFFETKFELPLDTEDEKVINDLAMIFVSIFHSTILLNTATYHLVPHL